MQAYNLTQGSILKNLIRFSLPYLLSCFLQTFYGLADLFITGQFCGAASITAVAVGSQVTHMLTLVIVGLAMGTTVILSRAVGAGERDTAGRAIGSTVSLFAGLAVVLTVVLLLFANGILRLLSVPAEAMADARNYVRICFAGIPLITAYNVLSSIYRGLGDTRRPMYFVAVAGVLNIGLDYLFIGFMHMAAAGAALATVIAQGVSVVLALRYMRRTADLPLTRRDFYPDREMLGRLLRVGIPVAAQDGFIQAAFLTITVIANRRGVDVAAAVGIVEKFISFLFLVPSAMLSAVSAICAQNAGAGFRDRSRKTLYCAIAVSVGFGILASVVCQIIPESILRLFASEEPAVITLGAQYLRAYVFDCIFAAVHFCFSGFFCAEQKAWLSFAHNLTAVLLVRIPGAYLASLWFPETLYPMGLAAPLGSLLSALICVAVYVALFLREREETPSG